MTGPIPPHPDPDQPSDPIGNRPPSSEPEEPVVSTTRAAVWLTVFLVAFGQGTMSGRFGFVLPLLALTALAVGDLVIRPRVLARLGQEVSR